MSGPNRCASADKPAASSSAALSVLLSTFLGSVPDAARYEFRAGELTREPVRAERHVLKQKTIFIRGFGCQAHLLRALPLLIPTKRCRAANLRWPSSHSVRLSWNSVPWQLA